MHPVGEGTKPYMLYIITILKLPTFFTERKVARGQPTKGDTEKTTQKRTQENQDTIFCKAREHHRLAHPP